MPDSNEVGIAFQQKVQGVLDALESRHPCFVDYQIQPRMMLRDGIIVIPDFDLQITRVSERTLYLIECQERKRSSNDVLYKIQHIKSQSNRNTAIVVHAADWPRERAEAFREQGIMEMTFEYFKTFIERLSAELAAIEVVRAPSSSEPLHDNAMMVSIWDLPPDQLAEILRFKNGQRNLK